MSEIYSPGSIAGPQGPAGPAGSAGSVTALAGSVLPAMSGNLFDLNKVTTGYSLNSDGTLAANGNWSTTGLIYCAGMTSMIANLPITLFNASFLTYDANGNVLGSLGAPAFGSAYNTGGNKMNAATAFALPGTQVYVRFSYIPPWYGSPYAANDAGAMVYAASTGTATLPSSYAIFGYDTPTDVNAKVASVIATFPSVLAEFAQNALAESYDNTHNRFNYAKILPGFLVNSDGSLGANASFTATTIFCAGATLAITNLPFWVFPGSVCVCTYDATGAFIADITSTLVPYSPQTTGTYPSNIIQRGLQFPLPGNQTYLKFSWNSNVWGSWGYGSGARGSVFYCGTASAPPAAIMGSADYYAGFEGAPLVSIQTASQLGCALDANLSTGGGTDNAAVLNAFLATATPANPVKLIIDGPCCVSGLVISPTGNTTIEGVGWGSGIYMAAACNQDGIRIGPYTSSTGESEGAYNIAPPSRTAVNITIRNLTINGGGASSYTGTNTGQTPANVPVTGAPVHTIFPLILANCSGVLVDHVNFINPPAFCTCVSNADHISFRHCSFNSGGTEQDGVHLDGLCSFINIDGCDFSTGDDSIALNCPEGYGGDINDVTVTNCRFNNSMTVMRIYTSLDPAAMPTNNVHRARRIVVSNCTGITFHPAFNLGIEGGGLNCTSDADQIEDLTVSNCSFVGPGLMWIAQPAGSLVLRGISYTPDTTQPIVQTLFAGFIEELCFDDVRVERNIDGNSAPLGFLSTYNTTTMGNVSLINCRVVDPSGAGYASLPYLLDINCPVAAVRLEAIDMTQIAALVSGAGWTNVTALHGSGVLGTGVQVPDSVMDANALYLSSNASGAPSIKVAGTAKRLTLA